ncbi:hypothetical protein [Azohydromonas australica]|uniref:hypothetical protein n=1 Tax=Azohydromonas australica TaxID=364039 RepID=UPI00040D56D5|nr:hypothetical protein [Azohydromonas australica]
MACAWDDTALTSNAWCGEAAAGALAEGSIAWGIDRKFKPPGQPLAAPAIDYDQWSDPRVGWGVVLPDRDDVAAHKKALGLDAPEPIRELLARRAPAPVLRWRPELPEGKLLRYTADGAPAAPLSLQGWRGTGPLAVPHYLLIIASPRQIPWSVQYRLQAEAYVGRLDLDDAGLGRYVEALLGEWSDAPRRVDRPLIWCVDHGHPDITRLMRKTIAEKLHGEFLADAELDMNGGFITDADATQAGLAQALGAREPAFVMTSSHGATFPLDDPVAMGAQMGMPVDANHAIGQADALAAAWNPKGAIWYAHACCSAGSDARSQFEGLVQSGSVLGRTLAAIGQAGACSSPLPRALLGGRNPLGAFIGHVEPTFDWTLRDPSTGQVTSQHIIDALYRTLYLRERPPVGRAMSAYFKAVAGLMHDYAKAMDAVVDQKPDALSQARRARLLAMDRQAMVLLGDPTVRLPLPRPGY